MISEKQNGLLNSDYTVVGGGVGREGRVVGASEWTRRKKAREKENGLGKNALHILINAQAGRKPEAVYSGRGSGSGDGGKNAKIRFVVARRGAAGSRHAAHV